MTIIDMSVKETKLKEESDNMDPEVKQEPVSVETKVEPEPEPGTEVKVESKPEPIIRGASTITEGKKVYRHAETFYRMAHSEAWGYYLMPIPAPEGSNLSKEEINGIRLNENFPKIPAELWSPWIALCFYMCPQTSSTMSSTFHDRQLEVQVCLLRDEATKQKWKIVVPKQVVSGVSVKAELNENVDIVTGERYKQFPPEGWLHAGTSHSHNTMGAFFSGVDDRSELGCPGFHVVIGNIDHANKQYTYASSVVLRKMRKDIELEEVVDITPMEKPFHEDVLEYIDTVVSANRKLYAEKLNKKPEIDKKSLLPWAGLDGFSSGGGEFFSSDTRASWKDEIDIDDIDSLDDLDYFDLEEDKHFPYHEEVATLVDSILSQGYSMASLLLSMRKAKEEFDAFCSEAAENSENSESEGRAW